MQEHLLYTLKLTALSVLFWIVLLGSIALGTRYLLPSSLYDHTKPFFRTRKWELRLYDALRIRVWKDYLPELGGVVGFAKDHMPDVVNAQYVDRFLWETCYTEFSHWICMPAGWLYTVLALCSEELHPYANTFAAISAVNFFAHLPFIVIQRYNRPRLEMLKSKFHHEM